MENQDLNTMSESEALDTKNHIEIVCGGCMRQITLHVDQINFYDSVPYCPYCEPDREELEDELNPDLMLQTIRTSLLEKIADGTIDPIALAKAELDRRGVPVKEKKVKKGIDAGHVTVTMADEEGGVIKTWTIGNGLGLEGTPMNEEDCKYDFYVDESQNDWEHIAEIMDAAEAHFNLQIEGRKS